MYWLKSLRENAKTDFRSEPGRYGRDQTSVQPGRAGRQIRKIVERRRRGTSPYLCRWRGSGARRIDVPALPGWTDVWSRPYRPGFDL